MLLVSAGVWAISAIANSHVALKITARPSGFKAERNGFNREFKIDDSPIGQPAGAYGSDRERSQRSFHHRYLYLIFSR